MDLNNLFDAVMALDLTPIKAKLMHVESGEGWSLARVEAVEKEYRRFLCLMKLYPDEETAPLVDVDTFWHYHILDTMKYASDCERAFGYFLHHYPYVGLRGDGDLQFRVDSGDRMRALYESTFSEAYPAMRMARPTQAPAATYRVRYGIGVQEGAMIAWCASPGSRDAALESAATAWCASPGSKTSASNDAVAWCASPGAKGAAPDGAASAWCASPGSKTTASNDATAWCASPGTTMRACAA
jgi:hypothetical protein